MSDHPHSQCSPSTEPTCPIVVAPVGIDGGARLSENLPNTAIPCDDINEFIAVIQQFATSPMLAIAGTNRELAVAINVLLNRRGAIPALLPIPCTDSGPLWPPTASWRLMFPWPSLTFDPTQTVVPQLSTFTQWTFALTQWPTLRISSSLEPQPRYGFRFACGWPLRSALDEVEPTFYAPLQTFAKLYRQTPPSLIARTERSPARQVPWLSASARLGAGFNLRIPESLWSRNRSVAHFASDLLEPQNAEELFVETSEGYLLDELPMPASLAHSLTVRPGPILDVLLPC